MKAFKSFFNIHFLTIPDLFMFGEGEGEDGRREDGGGEAGGCGLRVDAVGGLNSAFIFMNPAISIGLAMRSDILGGPWLAPSNRLD